MSSYKLRIKSSENHAIEVSREFYETLKLIGPLHTIQCLKKARIPSVFKSDLRLVARAVCRSFQIEESFLLGNTRKYPKKQAFAIWCYIGFHEMKFTLKDLLIYADSNESTISQAKKGIIDLIQKKDDKLTPFDKKVMQKIEKSRELLQELISEDALKTKESEVKKSKTSTKKQKK